MSRLIGFPGNGAAAHMDLLVSDLNKICALRVRSGNDSVMFLILVAEDSRAYEAIDRRYCLCVYVSYAAPKRWLDLLAKGFNELPVDPLAELAVPEPEL